MPRGGKRPEAGRKRRSDPMEIIMADPTMRLTFLITTLVRDPADQKTLAAAIERYRSAHRRGESKTFRNVVAAIDAMQNPKPLVTTFEPLVVDDSWRDFLLPPEQQR